MTQFFVDKGLNQLWLQDGCALLTAVSQVLERKEKQPQPGLLPSVPVPVVEISEVAPAEIMNNHVASWHQLVPDDPQVLYCCPIVRATQGAKQSFSASFNASHQARSCTH